MAVFRTRRMRGGGLVFGLMVVGGLALSMSAEPAESVAVQNSEPVVWVEEDWVMTLNAPDDSLFSPQFHTLMSPTGDVDGNYAQVLWNYRETPDFRAGGIQLQSYDGDALLRVRSVESRPLSSEAETITWTQGLWTDGAVLTFYIDNGSSTTWGSFGRDMRIDETTAVPDLSRYSPDASAANCRITYGTNRVQRIMITQVRYYSTSGLLSVDETPRKVYQHGDDFD